MSRARRVSDFLGLRRSIVGLLGMVVLVGLGEHMAEQYLPLYLVALGGGVLSAAGLNALDNLLGALYSYPGGYLSDRLGAKRALLLFNGFAAVGFLIVILIPAWQAVLIGSVFFLSWSAISLPASMALVAGALPKRKHTMGVAMHSLIRRFPMAVGPLIGGLCIAWYGTVNGVRLAFAAALLFALVAMLLQQVLIAPDPPRSGATAARDSAATHTSLGNARRPGANPWRILHGMSPPLRNLLVSDVLVRFCEQIPYAFVVLYVVTPPAAQPGLPTIPHPITAAQFGVLRALEMATAAIVYIPVAYLADRAGKKPFVLITFVFFAFFPLALLYARDFTWLVPVFVLRGLKEFGDSTRKALILDLAPDDAKAATFGAYYLVRDAIVSLAALAGGFLWAYSPAANLLTAFVFGVLGTFWFARYGRDLGKP